MKKVIIAIALACSLGLLTFSNAAVTKSKTNTTKSQTVSKDKININKASVKELQTLPCIGKKRAQAIIDYRTKNGNFKSVDDLKNIKGCSEKCITKISTKATV